MDSLSELIKYQESVFESLEQENDKWREGTSELGIEARVEEARHYWNKLLKVQQDVRLLQEKTNGMKKRSQRLQKEMEKAALDMEHRRQKRQETDKKLSPVIRVGGSSGSPLAASSDADAVGEQGNSTSQRPKT